MTRLNERRLDAQQFQRRKATADTLRKMAGWDTWQCDEPAFEYHYDRRVSLYVHHGLATLTFDNGETVDLEAGDFLTIEPGASANWAISQPIKTCYLYHDTFSSAANRNAQVYWSGE